MTEGIIDMTMQMLKKCPVCNQQYRKRGVALLRSNENNALVYAQCDQCTNGLVWFVSIQPFGGVLWSGMRTDLSRDELERLDREMPINEDEVLDIHLLLQSNATVSAIIAPREQPTYLVK